MEKESFSSKVIGVSSIFISIVFFFVAVWTKQLNILVLIIAAVSIRMVYLQNSWHFVVATSGALRVFFTEKLLNSFRSFVSFRVLIIPPAKCRPTLLGTITNWRVASFRYKEMLAPFTFSLRERRAADTLLRAELLGDVTVITFESLLAATAFNPHRTFGISSTIRRPIKTSYSTEATAFPSRIVAGIAVLALFGVDTHKGIICL